MRSQGLRRICAAIMCLSLLSLPPPVPAAIVTTDRAIALESRGEWINTIRAGLSRDDLRMRMLAFGVDPQGVDSRLASLSDVELARLAEEIDSAPAGGDVLAIIGVVFLVLLLLEYTGTIDIFKKVP